MKLRTKLGIVAATGLAVLAMASPAWAGWPGGIYYSETPTQTGARYTTGSGYIRAWQYCESSNGQTNWYSWGPWQTINVWSWTGTCSIIRSRGYTTSPS